MHGLGRPDADQDAYDFLMCRPLRQRGIEAIATLFDSSKVEPCCMPASSLYWIQKSASRISNAAGNRSRAASPGVGPPLALAVRVLIKNPAPTVPAPTARDFPKKERRLIERLYGLLFSSSFCVCGWSWVLPISFAVDALFVFMPVESQRSHWRAASQE